MRTNIVLDDDLMREAMALAGTSTKRATVEAGLRALIERERRRSVLELRGQLRWEGDLDRLRTDLPDAPAGGGRW
jgi:Arc/MetJ family transcription regulator